MVRVAGGLFAALFVVVSCDHEPPPGLSVPEEHRILATVIPGGNTETIAGEGSEGVFVEGREVALRSFAIACRETSWELWREVCRWAASHGYRIANSGAGLSGGSPVTDITWRDAVVWCNAYSEMAGLDPVYYVKDGVLLRKYGSRVPSICLTR
jgi:hypothetical protein